MVIFHSYVKLPEGKSENWKGKSTWTPEKFDEFPPVFPAFIFPNNNPLNQGIKDFQVWLIKWLVRGIVPIIPQ